MRHHFCVTANRNAYKQHVFAMKNLIDALEKNEMPQHTREEMEAAVEAGHLRTRELIGELAGMYLQWAPTDEASNKLVEAYLAIGGNFSHVTDGMKQMSKEMQKQQRDAEREANPPQSDGGGLSDEAHTAMKDRQREVLGHSKYHPLGGRHGSQGA